MFFFFFFFFFCVCVGGGVVANGLSIFSKLIVAKGHAAFQSKWTNQFKDILDKASSRLRIQAWDKNNLD